uniref:Putative ovule protein n=1 Tax=Solanum chacoense TaxID=4108 RepID=A0A0V0HXU1_SOLCH
MFPGCEDKFLLYNLPTENFPSLSCFHLIVSGLVFKQEKSFNLCSKLATLSTSQSFRSLLKMIFHPWLVQVSAIDASGLPQKENKSGKSSMSEFWPIHLSFQNRILVPSPTLLPMLPDNLGHKFIDSPPN